MEGRYTKWDMRYLWLASVVSKWSKDPDKKVGAVITDERYVRGLGYNGLPRGIADSAERLQQKDTKLDLTIHAEENALFASDNKGTCIYTFPCLPCMRCFAKLCQTNIRRVVSIEPSSLSSWQPSKVLELMQEANFIVQLYKEEDLLDYAMFTLCYDYDSLKSPGGFCVQS